jgi:cytochrome bd ubiquinol oxidase subunit I
MLEFFKNLDVLLLARIQFAFTISFHIIFPAFTIGLASFLAVIEFRYLRTKKPVFKEIYKFWSKIFAVAFGMGVVSGIVMSYQFGTNWSIFSDKIANVIGPVIGFEVLTAFFLEASFLGIMLFGWGRVSEKMHFVSTCIVAGGTVLSAFWILSANSWMQTPSGYTIADDGRFFPTDWIEIVFNPSFIYRFMHMVTAAYLTTAFVIGGVGAFYLIRHKYTDHAKIMISMATWMAAIVAPVQILIGDLHGINTLHHQPLKVSAMEGIWETEKSAALRLFAVVDEENETNKFELKIPYLASLILTHSLDGEVKGIKEWSKEERPPIKPVFWSFRIMVGLGILMMLTGIISAIGYYRGFLFNNKTLQKWWIIMSPSGFIAILAGWFVTEIGRQPYTVYGLLKTVDSATPAISSVQVAASLLAFVAIYIFIFGAALFYIFSLISKGISISEDSEQFYAHGVESAMFTRSKK